MHKRSSNATDQNGNVIEGATVTVNKAATGTPATIYSDNGVTTKANPITVDAEDGHYTYYAANGRYSEVIAATGRTFDAAQTSDLGLYDPREDGIYSWKDVEYGATGLGVANDRTAIQAAIAALTSGGVSHGPVGTYLLTSALTHAAAVVLRGCGYGTNLTVATAAEHNIIEVGAISHWEIRDLRLTGGGATSGTRHGILATGSADGRIDKVTVANVDSSGIYLLDADRITVTNVRAVGIADQGNGIYLNGARECVVAHNLVRVGKFGIAIVGVAADPASSRQSENITVVGNVVTDMSGVTGTGIDVNDALAVTVTGNTVDSCSNVGIQLKNPTGDDTQYNVASSNTVSNSTLIGIYCQDGSRSRLTGNTVHTSGAEGIYVNDAPSTRVSGNFVVTTGKDGIKVNNASNCTVTDNHVEGVPSGAAIAEGVQTYTDGTNPANNETFIVGDITYTMKTVLTGAADEVLIGADADATMTNLVAAINDTGTESTDYGTGTVRHAIVSAAIDTGTDTVTLTARAAGTNGNETVTATLSGVTVADVTGGAGYACIALANADGARIDNNTLVLGSASYHIVIDKNTSFAQIGALNRFTGTVAISDRGVNTKYPAEMSQLIDLTASAPVTYLLGYWHEGFVLGRLTVVITADVSGTTPVVAVGSLADTDGHVLAMNITGAAGAAVELPINGVLGRTVGTNAGVYLLVSTAAGTTGTIHVRLQGIRRQ